jgi:hypothetical protein
MKPVKILSLILFLGLSSCEKSEVDTQNPQRSETAKLLQKLLSSADFERLNIPISDLAINNPQLATSTSGNKHIILFKKETTTKMVIGSFNQDNDLAIALFFEVDSDKKSFQDIYTIGNELETENFIGSMNFITSRSSTLNLEFKNSRITHKNLSTGEENERAQPKCDGAADVAGCAISGMAKMRPIARLACFIGFAICMAVEAADCLIEGCI